MSTIYLQASCRLGQDAILRTSNNSGKQFCTGLGFLLDGADNLAISLVAFEQAVALEFAKYRKGDKLRVAGTLQRNDYEGRDGLVKQYQLVVDSVWGNRRAKPVQAALEPRTRTTATNFQAPEVDEEFDDAIPFG